MTEPGRPNHLMYDQSLKDAVERAVARVETTLGGMAPYMSKRISHWMRELSGSSQPADYFLHPSAFPMFLLPWWVEKAIGGSISSDLQENIVYSTVNGYYYIRLIDNVMDKDGEGGVELLPALNFFHTECQFAYQPYFEGHHRFWTVLRATWFRSGEVAMEDAVLTDLNEDQFKQVAAQKVGAVKIPVAAVCYYHDRADVIPMWNRLIDLLGCWHQMMNDLFDWRKDLAHDNKTFFLSEGRRRLQPSENIAEWVLREGFRYGNDLMHTWMRDLKAIGIQLNSPELIDYLTEREERQRQKEAEVAEAVRGMLRLMAAIR